MSKKKILICIDWFVPGFKAGGPIRSVANIVNAFKKDFEFYILTSAYDLGEETPYENVLLNQWHDDKDVFIKYLDSTHLNYPTICANINEVGPDVIYLNSLFSKIFTLYPLRYAKKSKTKVILAPRGMLGKGALGIKSGKKNIFLTIAKTIGVYKNVVWHASTNDEDYEIKAVFGQNAKVKIAQNIPIGQEFSLENVLERKKNGQVKFVFISRIAKKKNLHMAIEALKKVVTDKKVDFDIYGNIEDETYYETFKDNVDKDFGNLKVNYKGVINPSKVSEVYANADFMLLPTMHENYGHAIVEAWANGCPVIISKYTPWKNLQFKEIGWDVDIEEPLLLEKVIQESVDLDFASYIHKARESYLYFQNSILDETIINSNKQLFSE